ncbi:hypothetical protein D9611_010520 [Ephemerocybe angulata]|uniref:NADH dehydrogenase [ubiquinone] 1 alpha subcomplex subunit 12 n=1 Tax=Ephemerocybe angulata TaxID=980116 RepID=A0A8H5BX13_9AGAR|nr:hypothetical protein D9611_010520 [Tulosesus angulatus]
MSFLSKVWTAIRTPKPRFVGKDLQGNKFYERALIEMGRPKRTVVYKNPDDMWDYVGGQKRLAIQWSAWLAHTRPNPPTVEELKVDAERQVRVKYNASLIEARDREEGERLKRLRAERHAELVGAPSRGESDSAPYHEVRSTGEPEPATQSAEQDTILPTPNPWDAAKNVPETEAWAPGRPIRRRGD